MDVVHFEGDAWDNDEGQEAIVAWLWSSDVDGELAYTEDFDLPAANLTDGTHLVTFKVEDDEICFIGDDLIDVPVLKRAGLAVCPPNAVDEVRSFAHFITGKGGGRGAIREVCDFILKAQGKWDEVTSRYFND